MARRLYLGLLVAVLLAAAAPAASSSPYMDRRELLLRRVYSLHERITALAEKGVDVGDLALMLNRSLMLIEKGRLDEASGILDDVEGRLDRLEPVAEQEAYFSLVQRLVLAALAVAAPFLFYYLFPRIYLSLWLRLYGDWFADEVHG